MSFGLTSTPAVFQALINVVLRDFINRCAFVYLDHILMFSQSMAQHVKHASVEVDASDSGVSAILSQQVEAKMHPCVFFSHHLSSAERNYDVGDRELLAIKLALEEWQHWLEGASTLWWCGQITRTWCISKRRSVSMLCKQGLFFTRFNLPITYRPGSRNTKADALSRQFTPDSDD